MAATFPAPRYLVGPPRTVPGDLTIHGVTRSVDLAVEIAGHARPLGEYRAIFSATTRVGREDFGGTWNVALEAGGVLVSKDIEVETVLQR